MAEPYQYPKKDVGVPAPPVMDPASANYLRVEPEKPVRKGLNPWVFGIPAILAGVIMTGDKLAAAAMAKNRPTETVIKKAGPQTIAMAEVMAMNSMIEKGQDISQFQATQAISKDYKDLTVKVAVMTKAMNANANGLEIFDLNSPKLLTKEGRKEGRAFYKEFDKSVHMHDDVRAASIHSFLKTWNTQLNIKDPLAAKRFALEKKARRAYNNVSSIRSKVFAFLDTHPATISGQEWTFGTQGEASLKKLMGSYEKACGQYSSTTTQYLKMAAKEEAALFKQVP